MDASPRGTTGARKCGIPPEEMKGTIMQLTKNNSVRLHLDLEQPWAVLHHGPLGSTKRSRRSSTSFVRRPMRKASLKVVAPMRHSGDQILSPHVCLLAGSLLLSLPRACLLCMKLLPSPPASGRLIRAAPQISPPENQNVISADTRTSTA